MDAHLQPNAELSTAIERLQSKGLVTQAFDSFEGMKIYRPVAVPGNRREDYHTNLIHSIDPFKEEVLDAPISELWHVKGTTEWAFRAWDYTPGPGPGDFEKRYPTLEEATTAVFDYYFGDPAWMCAAHDKYRLKKQARTQSDY